MMKNLFKILNLEGGSVNDFGVNFDKLGSWSLINDMKMLSIHILSLV